MNVLIYNFDSVNPLAHEWAHLLDECRVNVTLVNHRKTIDCQSESISVNSIKFFKPECKGQFDVIFLPWIPSREYLVKFYMDWIKCGFPPIVWIDHNPIKGRDREGMILKFLRKSPSNRIIRVVHGTNSLSGHDNQSVYFLHPIYLNAFENIDCEPVKYPADQLNLSFIGRLDEQKGFFELPRYAELISKGTETPINWIIAGNNHNLARVQVVIDALRNLPNVSVEAHIYGKKCPDEFIMKAITSSDFLLAPYRQITASGTIALAIALGTEVISIGNSIPTGLEEFFEESLHFINDDNLVEFVQEKLIEKKESKIQIESKRTNYVRKYNEMCAERFLTFIELTTGIGKDLNRN